MCHPRYTPGDSVDVGGSQLAAVQYHLLASPRSPSLGLARSAGAGPFTDTATTTGSLMDTHSTLWESQVLGEWEGPLGAWGGGGGVRRRGRGMWGRGRGEAEGQGRVEAGAG
jgi:hypothetical protein